VAPAKIRGQAFAVVADDDDDARALVVALVRRRGFHVIEAKDGADLLREVSALLDRNERVELVISDIGMPSCDGIEAAEQLLQREPSLFLILMTAFGDQATVRRAREAGARHVLRKPFALATLEQLLPK
jgi:CheY-like chemotaxis protein